jgi:hypothetical protein
MLQIHRPQKTFQRYNISTLQQNTNATGYYKRLPAKDSFCAAGGR